jgi:hypothetical protein
VDETCYNESTWSIEFIMTAMIRTTNIHDY